MESRTLTWQVVTAVLGIALGVAALSYTGALTFSDQSATYRSLKAITAQSDSARQSAEISIRQSQEISAQLEDTIKALKTGVPLDDRLAQRVAQIEATQTALSQRMKALEDSLLATPATSLGLPLLRKDIEELRERMQANDLASREADRRNGEILRWLFGLIAAGLFAIVAQWFGARFKASLDKTKTA